MALPYLEHSAYFLHTHRNSYLSDFIFCANLCSKFRLDFLTSFVAQTCQLLRIRRICYALAAQNTALLQIIRQRAVAVETNYYTITQLMAPLADA